MTVPAFDWHQPVQVSFGAGCSDTLAEALGERAVCVLAFAPATALGLRARWQARLGARLRAWIEVPEGLSTFAMARHLAADLWPALADAAAAPAAPPAVLVGLGGGSALDLAKLLRVRPLGGDARAGFEAVAAAVRGEHPWPAHLRTPLWLVPTTAGTGSEVTRWATLWDTDGELAVKRSFDEPWGHADRAFVDPALTTTAPAAVTRDSALDALSHALEALWNRHANPVSDALAVQAARRVVLHLPAVLRQPGVPAGREQLALAALEAGLAFAQTRTALAHALSYPLTLEQGVPHGLAVAAWLPTAWELAAGREPRLDALLARVFDVPAAAGAGALRRWLAAMGVADAMADGGAAFGITDGPARLQAALRSERGRNFIGAAG